MSQDRCTKAIIHLFRILEMHLVATPAFCKIMYMKNDLEFRIDFQGENRYIIFNQQRTPHTILAKFAIMF